MIERITLVILLSITFTAAYYVLRHRHMRRMQPFHVTQASPTLLYFRGDHCAICPAQERTINQWAQQRSGDLHIEQVDAERDPETAARYNVFSLPTTIWIDGDGRVRHVNYGLTDANKLDRQLSSILEKKVDGPAMQRPGAIESANP